MDAQTIQTRIKQQLPDAQVSVTGEEGKYTAEVISSQFAGQGTLERHRLVYATLQAEIQSGAVHALTIKAKTPDE